MRKGMGGQEGAGAVQACGDRLALRLTKGQPSKRAGGEGYCSVFRHVTCSCVEREVDPRLGSGAS